MKKILILLFTFLCCSFANAEVFEAGVSIEEIPKTLFGSWRVSALLDTTNSRATFKPQSIDFWNLSRTGESITLDNPFSGANTTISVKTVSGNLIVFSKKATYDNNKVLTDVVTIRLNENSFTGINDLKLETLSLVDKHVLKTETAKYIIKGEKISGDSILKND